MGLSSLLISIGNGFPEQFRFIFNEDIFLAILLLMFVLMFHNILSLNLRFKKYEEGSLTFSEKLKRKIKKQEKSLYELSREED